MKRAIILFFLVFLGVSFAAFAQSRSIFIEGTAAIPAHQAFFMENFRMEGAASGYNIVERRGSAGYIFRFEAGPNLIEFEDGSREQAPPGEDQHLIQIRIVRNTDNVELVSFGFTFNDINDMYEYNQYLFLRAAVNIPDEGEDGVQVWDDSWRNKWLYLRTSANYNIEFLLLNDANLIDGKGVYDGDFYEPDRTSAIDNRITALPGAKVGLEVQFLDFLSLEPNVLVLFGDKDQFITMFAGAELKVPLKMVGNVVLSPYGAFSYPLMVSQAFSEFPPFTVGAGLQVAFRGGSMGAFFVDLNGMYSLSNATLFNDRNLFPYPEEIDHQRLVIGIGLGYKFGFLDR